MRGIAKLLVFYAILLVFVAILSSCTVLDFSCSTGEYGPRASVIFGKRDAVGYEFLAELSRLCSAEVEDDA